MTREEYEAAVKASTALTSGVVSIEERKKEFEEYLKQHDDGGYMEVKLDVRAELRKIAQARAGRYDDDDCAGAVAA